MTRSDVRHALTRWWRPLSASAVSAAVLASTWSSQVRAQRGEGQRGNDVARCAAAAGAVQNRVGKLDSVAMHSLVGCDAEIAAALPAEWRRVTDDTGDLNALITLSLAVRDQRLFNEVARLTEAEGTSFLVRGAAFVVLVGYYNPLFVGWVDVTRAGVPRVSLGERLHVVQRDGPVKVDAGSDARIESILRAIQRDSTSRLRGWANYVFVMSRELCSHETVRPDMRHCPPK